MRFPLSKPNETCRWLLLCKKLSLYLTLGFNWPMHISSYYCLVADSFSSLSAVLPFCMSILALGIGGNGGRKDRNPSPSTDSPSSEEDVDVVHDQNLGEDGKSENEMQEVGETNAQPSNGDTTIEDSMLFLVLQLQIPLHMWSGCGRCTSIRPVAGICQVRAAGYCEGPNLIQCSTCLPMS